MDAQAFRDALLQAGLLVDAGSPGLYGRGAEMEEVVLAVDAWVGRLFGPADVMRFPPVLPVASFQATGYLRSFPQLTGAVSSFRGDDAAHARLLAAEEEGGDWHHQLEPAGVVLTPSVCHPLYPTLRGTLPAGGRRVDVSGYVFRHEPSLDPARMQAFRQHDLVVVGTADQAREHQVEWADRAADALADLDLPVVPVAANDPFFGRAGRLLAAGQRGAELKTELVAAVAEDDQTTAVVSSNLHEDHFGAGFGIRTSDGAVAHSACVGFGLERTSLGLLRRHGLRPRRWSPQVRAQLWP